MKNMKWFTNEHAEKADDRIKQLEQPHKNRVYIKWQPVATKEYSVAQMKQMGFVGIYEISPCEGCYICERIKTLDTNRKRKKRIESKDRI